METQNPEEQISSNVQNLQDIDFEIFELRTTERPCLQHDQ
jgi:hypothetical protein